MDLEKIREMNLTPKKWNSDIVDVPTGGIQKKSYKKGKIGNLSASVNNVQLKPSQYTFNLPTPTFFDKEGINNEQEKGLLEIGKVITMDVPLTLFRTTSPVYFTQEKGNGYSIYSLNFFAENAMGIKLHFVLTDLLPPLHNLYIMGNNGDNEVIPVMVSDKDIWSPLIYSSEVTLFYVLPESSSFSSVPITIDQYAYIYTDPIEEMKMQGTCYEDVMCYEPWKTLSKGVVGIVRVAEPSVIFCTGSLLNDGNDEQLSQLILTAFHCVSNQSTAETLEFIWMYQTVDCKGIVPSITSVPKTTGGADFLIGSDTYYGTDMSLLRMKNAPPNNVLELGFTNAIIPVGTGVVAIHHPGRSYKRISFGSMTDTGSPSYNGDNLRPLDKYHEVIYSLSSTEAGSSGCPLFRENTQQIIGQLWGGNAFCNAMNEPDYYGRFDVSYPLIEPFIFIPPNIFDVDNSGTVDNNDLNLVVNAVLGINSTMKTDFNNDSRT
ncbi:MAG: trypsin-like serine peptidase, partial [Candidatus Hydrogenedens sp.]